MPLQKAPAWQTTRWFNTAQPLELAQLRGKVIVLHAFQMLCPGCVANAIPQAKRLAQIFASAPLAVIGLHTVFEHHAVMGPEALEAFLHEYRVGFPVGVDAPDPQGNPIPTTMRSYGMQGTPTTVLIDAHGHLRHQVFGSVDDLALGAEIGALLAEMQFGPAATTGESRRPAGP
ncbi:MAG: redoxin domain-containing protein [Gammaproteobacteria bacterium]|nr:redoxin domain-containing protein [Gammaproteobacteria bacterium]